MSNILDGLLPEQDFAQQCDKCTRTTTRWRNLPDGLPYVKLGNSIYIPVKEGREWIMGQMRRNNPRRKAS